MPTEFQDRIRAVLESLEPGDVVSYGEVAELAGRPGASRAVGHFLKHATGVPWWRVVAANGRLVPGNERRQQELLEREGAVVRNGRVVAAKP